MDLWLNSSTDAFKIDLSMDQQETVSDWSTGLAQTLGTSVKYAPGGTHFTHVWKPDSSGVWGWVGIGPGVFWHTGLIYTDTNMTMDTFNNWDWWIQSVNVRGDTPGPDISNGCPTPTTDSGAYVNFNTLYLWSQ